MNPHAAFRRWAVTACTVALMGAAMVGAPARANIINVMYTFSTGANGNTNQSGTASFDFTSANAFTLTLDNTDTVIGIASVLDGFNFTAAGVTGITLTGISSTDGLVDCTASTNKVSSCADTAGPLSTSDWNGTVASGAVQLQAGSGLHPYGIVNDSIDTNANLDGTRNGQHNPYIEGPVTFTFTTTGNTSIPGISNVVFLFGTVPAKIDGSCTSDNGCMPTNEVPEPATFALFAAGLAGIGLALGRRRKKI